MDFSSMKIIKLSIENNGDFIYEIEINNEKGILIIKQKYNIDLLQKIIHKIRIITANDRYFSFKLEKNSGMIIYPSIPSDWEKYNSKKEFVAETYQTYLNELREEKIVWIENIINGQAETDRIVHRDNELIIVIDTKWDGVDRKDLYLLAIFTQEVRCIREATLEMLQSARSKILESLKQKYRMDYKDVILFVHYPPSFYWMHIHVVSVEREMMKSLMAGRVILLDDAIKNLKLDVDYYKGVIYCLKNK